MDQMTPTEQMVWDTLVELDQAIKDLKTPGSNSAIGPLLARLDKLTLELPRDTNSALLH